MEKEEYWSDFMASGKVTDYLKMKQAERMTDTDGVSDSGSRIDGRRDAEEVFRMDRMT